MEREVAIEVKDLSVTYKSMKAYSIKKSLLQFKKAEIKKVNAVKHVSFTVDKGEIIGIVGKNGSGKSTLLNAIAGIFSPDTGSIDLKGNSISLLAIGAGFQREVTGRENIFLSGMLLGFSEKYIRGKMKEIIEFSELGDFIDMPVKTYSSGMYSKLAFSITAILETDIVLIDEVLSVGDAKFRKKSYDKIKALIQDSSRTALIVSHQESTLKDLCDRILWMSDGEVKMVGPTKEVLGAYMESMK